MYFFQEGCCTVEDARLVRCPYVPHHQLHIVLVLLLVLAKAHMYSLIMYFELILLLFTVGFFSSFPIFFSSFLKQGTNNKSSITQTDLSLEIIQAEIWALQFWMMREGVSL